MPKHNPTAFSIPFRGQRAPVSATEHDRSAGRSSHARAACTVTSVDLAAAFERICAGRGRVGWRDWPEALESALQHRAAASLSSRWLKASSSYRCFSSSSSAASSLCARISSFVCCSACNRASRTCGRRAERALRESPRKLRCAAYRQCHEAMAAGEQSSARRLRQWAAARMDL